MVCHNTYELRSLYDCDMIVELKVDKDAVGAIDQIKDKNYVEGLKGYSGEVLLVGIGYDRKEKKHTCVIEKIRK